MAQTSFELADVVFLGRTLDEYVQMFNLDIEQLHQMRILDSPSGPASFVAESRHLGLLTTGIDPVYSLSPADVLAKSEKDNAYCLGKLALNPEHFVWDTQAELEAFKKEKDRARQFFINDYHSNNLTETGRVANSSTATEIAEDTGEKRYVAASLPHLPFADKTFDLVLSGYLLFIYSDIESGGILPESPFDYKFHLEAILELARVANKQVKIYPLKGHNAPKHRYLDDIRLDLLNRGIENRLVPVSYRDITGANELLQLDLN